MFNKKKIQFWLLLFLSNISYESLSKTVENELLRVFIEMKYLALCSLNILTAYLF